jgi:outer membrane protein assembly factor BamE (lipoprotein component of BamABCDE complex)
MSYLLAVAALGLALGCDNRNPKQMASQISEGMTEAEVHARLGPPEQEATGPISYWWYADRKLQISFRQGKVFGVNTYQ